MKFRWLAAAVILVLSLGVGCLTYICVRKPMPAATSSDDALLWLRYEFKLSAEKLDRIAKMHEAYQDVCEVHCRNIREARAQVKKLQTEHAAPAEIAAAEAKLKEVDLVCTTSLEAHLREIANIIGGDDGRRYLAIVLPRIAHFEHTGAPNLDLGTSSTHDHGHH